jgi:hypothetical protein
MKATKRVKQSSTIVLLTILICFAVSGCSKKTISDQTTNPVTGPVGSGDSQNVLYNGIVLPQLWPPTRSYIFDLEKGMDVSYLIKKPDTINISVGRQLFVDDFLIASTTMGRTYHYPEYYASNPVLQPDKPWENLGTAGSRFAAPFSDGVWYDEVAGKFKMWYMAGGGTYSFNNAGVTCYAESVDGINWVKSNLTTVPNTNIVDYNTERDASVVWLDKQETNLSNRYKMFLSARDKQDQKWKYLYKTSADGKLWREVASSKPIADRSTVYKNAFRNNWVFSIRHNVRVNTDKLVRARDYNENSDPVEGTRKAEALLSSFWFGPWPNELRHPDYPNVDPAIYNQDAVPYESIMLGFFNVWQGPENDVATASGKPKRNQIMLGYSRDGYHWHRQDMNPFMKVGINGTDWNAGNLQSVAGAPIIVGDKLYFYLSGRYVNNTGAEITSTGLAILRRDGFVSLDASGTEKTVTTELFKFNGSFFFINARIIGNMKVELLDKDGNVLNGFSKTESQGFTGDATKAQIKWNGKSNVADLKGKAIRAKFYVTEGSLYSFWISPYETGESAGYTAGGGSGLNAKGIDDK